MSVDPKRVEALFAAALDRPASARAEFLRESCGDDAPLRERVERLIHAYSQAGQFLQEPAGPMGDSAILETPTEAFDTDPPSRQVPDPSMPTQAESHQARVHADLSFLSPSQKPGSLGRLAHYEVHAVLGKGGFGTVFKAFDELLHRVVAIKVLAPEMAASAAARQRFLREARAAAAVRHEHVVGIHAVAKEDEPLPYLVMEYVSGQTLQAKLDACGPLEVKEILRIGLQIAAGLEAAHKHGKIHRDIKPANILLENGIEHVKITDFGLARAVDDASVTQSGVVSGTPMYMSPEQAEGLALDHRSDLFSLGTVLYVMCTGRPPFRASGSIAVLKRVVEEKPRSIRDINSEIPQWLCDVVEKLHAKKPEERYQSAQEVAEALAKCLAGMQLHGGVLASPAASAAGDVSGARRLPGESATAPAAAAAKTPPRPPSRRPVPARVWVPAALAVLALVFWLVAPNLRLFVRGKAQLSVVADRAALEEAGVTLDVQHDGDTVRRFSESGDLELRPGEYEVSVGLWKGPFTRYRIELIRKYITGSAKPTVIHEQPHKITLGPGERLVIKLAVYPAPPVEPIPMAAPLAVERFVARWALEAGGAVTIRADKGGARTDVTDLAALPDNDFTVERIDLSKSRGITEAALGPLAGARGLDELVLRGLPIGDSGLPQLQALDVLEKLDLSGTKVSDRALVLLSELRGLKSLSLENTAVGDAALRLLEKTKQLKRLQGLAHLNVRKTAMTAAGVQALAKALPKCEIVSDHP